MIQKKAKTNAFLYWGIYLLAVLILLAGTLALFIWVDSKLGIIIFAVFIVFIRSLLHSILLSRLILRPYHQGNVELYRDTLRAAGLNNPISPLYLLGEVAAGEYAHVIDICTAQLERMANKYTKFYNKKAKARLHRYRYLHVLALCYFRLGDNEKLSQICQVYRTWLEGEKASDVFHISQTHPQFELYEAYLNKDIEACQALAFFENEGAEAGHSSGFSYGIDLYCQARVLADLQEDFESARTLYQEAAGQLEGCALQDLCRHALQNIENGVPYAEGLAEIVPCASYEIPISKENKRARILTPIVTILVALLTGAALLFSAPIWVANREQDTEHIIELIEKELDDVTVLQTYEPVLFGKSGGTVFVGLRESEIVIGTFDYSGKMNMYYRVKERASLPTASLKQGGDALYPLHFASGDGSYFICAQLFCDQAEIPANAPYTAFELDGQTYYLAVTSITQYYALYKGEEFVQTVLIDVTDTSVIIAYPYYYTDQPDRHYIREVQVVSLQMLTDPAISMYPAKHTSAGEDYLVTGCFYRGESEIPTDACEIYSFQVGEQTYYYAILQIE